MTTSPPRLPPLLVRRPLWPDESLYGYLIRLAGLNRYSLSALLGLFLPNETDRGPRLDNTFYPRQPHTYARLADLTRLSPAALYRATPHRYAALLALSRPKVKTIAIPGLGDVPALTADRPYTLRNERQAQFCPLCLQAAAYHRLWWTPVFVLVCLRHQCLLAAHCPGCGQAVSVAEVVGARCQRCGADLAQAPVHSVRGDRSGLFAQRTLQAWLEDRPAPANAWATSLPPQLPAALYYLATRLLAAILGAMDVTVNWKTPTLCDRLSPELMYALWARAFRALVAWPEGLYEFCEARTLEGLLRDAGLAAAHLSGPFHFRPPLLVAWNLTFAWRAMADANPNRRWRQPHRRRRAARAQAAVRLAGFRYLTIPGAARALGVPQVVVERLVVAGRLPGDLAQGEVECAAVLRLCRRWERPMTFVEARAVTGLARAHLRGLIERRVIQRARPEPGRPGTRLVRASVCAFMLAMTYALRSGRAGSRRRVHQQKDDQETLGLAESVALAERYGFTATDLFVLMFRGRLHGCPQPSPPDLLAVRFASHPLLSLLRGLRRRPRRRARAQST